MVKKICPKCKIEYPATNKYFYMNRSSFDELTARCKECLKEDNKKHRLENREKILEYKRNYRKRNKKKTNRYYQKNKEKILKHQKEYRQKYPSYYSRHRKERLLYNQRNKEKIKKAQQNPNYKKWVSEYWKQRRKTDPKYRLDWNMGKNIWFALRENKAGQHWESLVGYTLKELIIHLESQFDKNMSWNNYGSYWHVDHYIPKSWFMYENPKDIGFKICWGLDNLQPKEKISNIMKGNRYIG